jgi:hypothetical protein
LARHYVKQAMTGRLTWAALALLATGCLSAEGDGLSNECVRDGQCGTLVCANTGECVAESNIINVTINWTVNGEAVSPQSDRPCASVDEFSVKFLDLGGGGQNVEYSPVPCNLGRITYNKMPGRFDAVRVTAWSFSGYSLDEAQASLQLGQNTIDLDLRP